MARYCDDKPERSKLTLPTAEAEGVYGTAPLFVSQATGDFGQTPESPLRAYGQAALPEAEQGLEGRRKAV
ncbi:MAG: hypothetical protein WCP21_21210 [Armatimonadota bacterium]